MSLASASIVVPTTGEQPTPRGWQAELQLRLEWRHDRTCIVARRHTGPLVVQRPFYPEVNGCCHVYLVHPPGGIVGGDTVELSLTNAERARTLVTTPSATKLYKSQGERAKLRQRLKLQRDTFLEWLPQETIAFDGTNAELSTRVDIGAGAAFIGWETLCLGRPAAGERFLRGELTQKLEVFREGEPLLHERLRLTGAGPELYEAWGLNGRTTVASMVCVPQDPGHDLTALLAGVRDALAAHATLNAGAGLAAATLVSGALVVRFLGEGAQSAQRVLRRVWELARPELFSCPAVPPRIWAT